MELQPTILVVDDSEVVRSLLCDVLTHRGYRPLTVSNAPEALALLERIQVDAVLTDCHLGAANGLELCREVNAQAARLGRVLPVMIMSGSDSGDVTAAAKAAGAVAFLRKPFNPVALYRLLDEQLGVRS